MRLFYLEALTHGNCSSRRNKATNKDEFSVSAIKYSWNTTVYGYKRETARVKLTLCSEVRKMSMLEIKSN